MLFILYYSELFLVPVATTQLLPTPALDRLTL